MTDRHSNGIRDAITPLWELHRDSEWPASLGSHEGQLMMLDTVISGCVTYYLEEHSLDDQRVDMLQSCVSDLEGILDDVEDGDALAYFERSKTLATLLLTVPRREP